MSDGATSSSSTEGLPFTAKKLLWFQSFNALNFTIAIGAPLVLTARYLGATEFQIGLLNALAPGLVALQILTASLVDRIGYRELMLMGWSVRSFMLLLVVPLPLLVGRWESATLVWLMILFIFLFNMIRGLAAGAWLPWMKAMLPPEKRGHFFGIEQLVVSVSGFATMILAGLFLGEDPAGWRYSLLFVFAWLGGMGSVYFLRQTPPTIRTPAHETAVLPSPLEIFRSAGRIWRYPAFQRIAIFVAMHAFAFTALPIFLVLFLREELGWSDGIVLKIQSLTTLGVLLTALIWGRLADRVGSKPIMRLALGGQIGLTLFWLFCATGFYQPDIYTAGVVTLLWGVCGAAQGIPQARLVLGAAVPGNVTMSMAHYQVCVALCGAASPIILGLLLTESRQLIGSGSGGYSPPFLILFGFCLFLAIITQFLLTRVRERKAMRTGQFLLQMATDWPVKVLQVVKLPGRR